MSPKVIVGMMGSSVAKGSAAMATPESVQAFLDVCKAHKVRELDTALVYNSGQSEQLLRSVAADKQFAISTKAPGFSPGSLAYDKIISNCRSSLENLGMQKVDIYYIHGPCRDVSFEEQCRAFGQLHKEGKFERFGVSNLRVADVQEIYDICKREGYCLPSVYQGGYSPLQRGAEHALFPLLKKLEIQFYAFSPLAGGLLAKPIDQILKPAKDSRYDQMKVFGDIFLNDTLLAGLKKQTALCDKHGISIMEATMRWFAHHSRLSENDGYIIGASTKEQIEASLSATEKGPLPDEVANGFETMWEEIKESSPGYPDYPGF